MQDQSSAEGNATKVGAVGRVIPSTEVLSQVAASLFHKEQYDLCDFLHEVVRRQPLGNRGRKPVADEGAGGTESTHVRMVLSLKETLLALEDLVLACDQRGEELSRAVNRKIKKKKTVKKKDKDKRSNRESGERKSAAKERTRSHILKHDVLALLEYIIALRKSIPKESAAFSSMGPESAAFSLNVSSFSALSFLLLFQFLSTP